MKVLKLSTLLLIFILSGCGNSTKPEEKSIYKRTKTEKKEIRQSTNVTPVDLNNKGLGPIKEYIFETEINQTLAFEGKQIFNAKCGVIDNSVILALNKPTKTNQHEAIYFRSCAAIRGYRFSGR